MPGKSFRQQPKRSRGKYVTVECLSRVSGVDPYLNVGGVDTPSYPPVSLGRKCGVKFQRRWEFWPGGPRLADAEGEGRLALSLLFNPCFPCCPEVLVLPGVSW